MGNVKSRQGIFSSQVMNINVTHLQTQPLLKQGGDFNHDEKQASMLENTIFRTIVSPKTKKLHASWPSIDMRI